MTNLFISYRRDDTGGHAGRLSDRLVARFGAARVFMDVSDIQPGENFEQAIQRTLARCDHVLAVIGPRWLSDLNARQSSGEDFVRSELAAGLATGATVIPVLVGGAEMPSRDQLPPELVTLARCQAVTIEDRSFDDDAARLLNFLDGGTASGDARASLSRLPRAVVVSFIVTAALLAGAWWLWPRTAGDSAAHEPDVSITTPADPNLDGEWLAELQKSGQQPFRIKLMIARSGSQVIGTVTYPTGEAEILDGHYSDGQMTFRTSHTPQFESSPAIIRFQAKVEGDVIRLTSADAGGVATGTARRTTAPTR